MKIALKKTDLTRKVTVVIVTKDRIWYLRRTLNKLLLLPESFPILVVDNNSTDGTMEMVKKEFPWVTLIRLNKNIGCAGRNIGVKRAKTPFVAFADDDSWWDKGALSKAVQYFKKYPKLGLIAAKIMVRGKKIDPICRLMVKGGLYTPLKLPGPFILGFMACGVVVSKKAFLESGGFEERFGIGGEEELLATDMADKGWGLAYTKDIVVLHYPSPLRNIKRRKQIGIRDRFWYLWLRRPFPRAFKETLLLVKLAIKDFDISLGLIEGVRGIPWVMQKRRKVQSWLEAELIKLT